MKPKQWNLWKSRYPFLAPLYESTNSQEQADAWISAIEEQDTLFADALNIYTISDKFKLSDDYSNNPQFTAAARKKAYKIFLTDVFNFIQLGYPRNTIGTVTPSDIDLSEKSKIGAIWNKYDLVKLLHFPETVTNIFIKTLAGILYSLMSETVIVGTKPNSMTKILEYTQSDNHTKTLLIDQFSGNYLANAYTYTVGPPLDTLYPNQDIDVGDKILENNGRNFFDSMITELGKLCANTALTSSDLFGETSTTGCPKNISTMDWPILAAHIARFYMFEKSLDNLFKQFGTCEQKITTSSIRPFVPDSAIKDSGGSTIDGIPIINVLKSMGRERFMFVVHLRGLIRGLEYQAKLDKPLDSIRKVMIDLSVEKNDTILLPGLQHIVDMLQPKYEKFVTKRLETDTAGATTELAELEATAKKIGAGLQALPSS